MDRYLDAAIGEAVGIVIAIALATIAVSLALLFFLAWQIYVAYCHQQRLEQAQADAKRIHEEEGVTYDVDDILRSVWPRMPLSSVKEEEGLPGLG